MELLFRKIEEHNPEDIRQFNELMDALTEHAGDPQCLKEKIQEINAWSNAYLMVAEDRETGRLSGSLLAIAFGDFCGDCRPVVLVENVVTHTDYQRKGIGKRMFEEIEAWGRERNAAYIILCSSMNRTGAHEFYQAIGYDEVKGFKKYL